MGLLLIDSAESVDLVATDLSVVPILESPALGQVHALVSNDITLSVTLDSPALGGPPAVPTVRPAVVSWSTLSAPPTVTAWS